MKDVATAVRSADPHQCPDAVAAALDELYDLWELWTSTKFIIKRAEQNDAVRAKVDGETAAALVHARGGKTHDYLEFGDFTDTIAGHLYEHWGCWRWQPYSDARPGF